MSWKTGKDLMQKFIDICCTQEGIKHVKKMNVLNKRLSEKQFFDNLILESDAQLKKWVRPAIDIISDKKFINIMANVGNETNNVRAVTTYKGDEFSITNEKYTQTNFKAFYKKFFEYPEQIEEAVEVIESE